MFVNIKQVERVARRLAARRGQRFVGGDVRDVKRISKQIVGHSGIKSEVAVTNPFELRALAASLDGCRMNARLAPQPFDRKSFGHQSRGVVGRCYGNLLFTVMKDVDVVGEPRTAAVQGVEPAT